jgi:acetylornithine deacetylase/succinyl-diaminopimelate desuccinylase-like protein
MNIDMKLIEAVFSVEAESYDCEAQAENVALLADARGWDVERDEIGNVIVSHGTADVRPVLVAHLDTVHDITGHLTLHRLGRRLYAMDADDCAQIGVGGDDKCGIVAAIAVAEKLPAFRLLFVVDEEVGCHGSRQIDLAHVADASLILQADRRGGSDFVHRIGSLDLQSVEFRAAAKPLLKARGYSPSVGMMTDVEALVDRGAGVCAANLSAGYYNPHTSREYVDLDQLDNCAALMLAICQQLGTRRWALPPRPAPVPFSSIASKRGRPAGVSRLAWDWEQDDLRNEWDATTCPACGSLYSPGPKGGGLCDDCRDFWQRKYA